jgi:hypothetical protein
MMALVQIGVNTHKGPFLGKAVRSTSVRYITYTILYVQICEMRALFSTQPWGRFSGGLICSSLGNDPKEREMDVRR